VKKSVKQLIHRFLSTLLFFASFSIPANAMQKKPGGSAWAPPPPRTAWAHPASGEESTAPIVSQTAPVGAVAPGAPAAPPAADVTGDTKQAGAVEADDDADEEISTLTDDLKQLKVSHVKVSRDTKTKDLVRLLFPCGFKRHKNIAKLSESRMLVDNYYHNRFYCNDPEDNFLSYKFLVEDFCTPGIRASLWVRKNQTKLSQQLEPLFPHKQHYVAMALNIDDYLRSKPEALSPQEQTADEIIADLFHKTRREKKPTVETFAAGQSQEFLTCFENYYKSSNARFSMPEAYKAEYAADFTTCNETGITQLSTMYTNYINNCIESNRSETISFYVCDKQIFYIARYDNGDKTLVLDMIEYRMGHMSSNYFELDFIVEDAIKKGCQRIIILAPAHRSSNLEKYYGFTSIAHYTVFSNKPKAVDTYVDIGDMCRKKMAPTNCCEIFAAHGKYPDEIKEPHEIIDVRFVMSRMNGPVFKRKKTVGEETPAAARHDDAQAEAHVETHVEDVKSEEKRAGHTSLADPDIERLLFPHGSDRDPKIYGLHWSKSESQRYCFYNRCYFDYWNTDLITYDFFKRNFSQHSAHTMRTERLNRHKEFSFNRKQFNEKKFNARLYTNAKFSSFWVETSQTSLLSKFNGVYAMLTADGEPHEFGITLFKSQEYSALMLDLKDFKPEEDKKSDESADRGNDFKKFGADEVEQFLDLFTTHNQQFLYESSTVYQDDGACYMAIPVPQRAYINDVKSFIEKHRLGAVYFYILKSYYDHPHDDDVRYTCYFYMVVHYRHDNTIALHRIEPCMGNLQQDTHDTGSIENIVDDLRDTGFTRVITLVANKPGISKFYLERYGFKTFAEYTVFSMVPNEVSSQLIFNNGFGEIAGTKPKSVFEFGAV